MRLGNNIAKYRKFKRLTQRELAEVTGLSKGYIAAIEQGKRHPRIKELAIIAESLDISTLLLIRSKDMEG